jgi:hypothetical protein
MLQTSCQASRTISRGPRFRRAFFADAKNPCKMRLSCMYDTHPRKRDRCRPSRAQAADTATESCRERQKIVAKNFFGYRRGIRSRPIETRVKTRESPANRFARATSSAPRGRSTRSKMRGAMSAERPFWIDSHRSAGRRGMRVASDDRSVRCTGMRDRAGARCEALSPMVDSARLAPVSMIQRRARSVWDRRRDRAMDIRGLSACRGAPGRTAVTVRASP